MIPGKLRHRIVFQTKSTAVNSVGESTSWANYYECWASLDVLNSKLIFSTDALIADTTYMCVIRYPGSGVNIGANDRILFNQTTFEIQAVMNPEQRNRELRILCHVINEQD